MTSQGNDIVSPITNLNAADWVMNKGSLYDDADDPLDPVM